jgi:hypothetical protein
MTPKARKVLVAWLALNAVMLVLYTCVPPLFFNDGAGRIAGMPKMLFWFTVLPFVVPALMGWLYFYDRGLTQRPAAPDTGEGQQR